ncbi:hypothetical protein IAT40_000264 [Kwoniella sp. CBS 6097]
MSQQISTGFTPDLRVWSIPQIRSDIIAHLSHKDQISLLMLNKAYFQALVEDIYRNVTSIQIEIIQRGKDPVSLSENIMTVYKMLTQYLYTCLHLLLLQARKAMCLSAVRSIQTGVGWGAEWRSASNWARLIKQTPNATTLRHEFAKLKKEVQAGVERYSLTDFHCRDIEECSSDTPIRRHSIPQDWELTNLLRLRVSIRDFPKLEGVTRTERIRQALRAALFRPGNEVRELYIDDERPASAIFEELRIANEQKICMPRRIGIVCSDPTRLVELEPLAEHWKQLKVECQRLLSGTNSAQTRLNLEKYTKLETLDLVIPIDQMTPYQLDEMPLTMHERPRAHGALRKVSVIVTHHRQWEANHFRLEDGLLLVRGIARKIYWLVFVDDRLRMCLDCQIKLYSSPSHGRPLEEEERQCADVLMSEVRRLIAQETG